MIRPPSSQRSWDAFTTADPAIIQPPERPGDDASEADRVAHIEAASAWASKIKSARDTGDWSPIVLEGQQPTKFTLGHVDRNVWRTIQDRATLPADNPRHIGQVVLFALLFRLSVRAIAGWDKFERLPDAAWDNWTMAPADLVNKLDEINPAIVGELGMEVFKRLAGVSPLS